MNTGNSPMSVAAAVEELRRGSNWFLVEGIVLLVIGMFALAYDVLATLASVVFFGWLLIIGGLMAAVHGFWRKAWAGFFLDLISGILYLAVGTMIVANPGASALALTLVIALFLVFGGLFRIAAALAVRPPHLAWVVVNGVTSLFLGVLIWSQWPLSGLWVIGFFIAIEMIMNGWSLIMLGLMAKRSPASADA